MQVLGSGAAVQCPAAAEVLVNRDAPGGVVHRADVVAGAADDAAAVACINTADDQAQTAGEDGAPRIDHRPLVERQVAVNAVFLARGVKEDLLLAGGGEIHQQRFNLTGGHQLFHQGGDAQALRLCLDGGGQRLDPVILRPIGDVCLTDFAGVVDVVALRGLGTDKIMGEGGRDLHLDDRPDKINAVVRRKGTVFTADTDDPHILLDGGIARLVLTQTVHVANQRQRLAGALIGLDDARALRLRREQGHARFNRRHRVGGNALDDVAAHLAVAHAAIEQVADVLGFWWARDNHVRATKRDIVGNAHRAVNTTRVKGADGAGHIADGRKEFVLASGERVLDHQPAAVVGIGEAFGRVDLQVLFGEGGVFLWHVKARLNRH